MNGGLPFRVITVRQDGRERLFQAYATREEAQAVADRLCVISCPARVAEPEELLLSRRASTTSKGNDV